VHDVVGNAELVAGGNRFARALDAAGVADDATVGVLGGNRREWLSAHRGITSSGRTITPMSWRWTPDDVRYVITNSEATAVVVDARYPELAQAAAPSIDPAARFCYAGELPGFRPWTEVDMFDDAPLEHPLAGATMFYTSGTTGRPKGVRRRQAGERTMHTLGQSGMRMLREALSPEDEAGTHLVCTPLYHAGPLTYADGAALLGADLVILERFDPETVLQLVERYRVVSTFMVPTQFVRLLRLPDGVRAEYDLSSLKAVIHGSAPVAVETKRAMIHWFGPVLHEFYGGSEGAGSTGIGSVDWLAHPGSVGKTPSMYTCVILDDDGNELAPGEVGQIWFRGAVPFEYKDDPTKTAEAWRGDLSTLGDVGYVDSDGYLYLCDRRADVIISGGVNIYPAQIEAELVAHPDVADCCVVGIPDDDWGEAVHAVVQPVGPVGPAFTDELLAFVAGRLPRHTVPKTMELRDALPRTETGKLARRAIRDPFWAGRERKI
jgi:long-chain acyl-CoA synthetase